MSEDDSTSERCPICKDKECKIHLLGRFDESGDEGVFGIGLVDGPLFDVKEIEEVLQRAQLAWVQSVRAAGKPEIPQWIMKSQSLRDYYDQLGDAGDFDPEEYESDEDAAGDLGAHARYHNTYATELVEDLLDGCGWIEKTKEYYEAVMRSTTYVSWWTSEPSKTVERFKGKLRTILLEAEVASDPHATLEAKSLTKRIAAVAMDVASKRDEYRSIDPYELAELLGIDDAHKRT